ncbi:MAG: dockerin type I domain-containing protein [Clostridiales bacterium]|nr:dockerin type I domain-containing protein [Clostridiales bacterium]
MKKLLTLIVTLALVLGLTASAWSMVGTDDLMIEMLYTDEQPEIITILSDPYFDEAAKIESEPASSNSVILSSNSAVSSNTAAITLLNSVYVTSDIDGEQPHLGADLTNVMSDALDCSMIIGTATTSKIRISLMPADNISIIRLKWGSSEWKSIDPDLKEVKRSTVQVDPISPGCYKILQVDLLDNNSQLYMVRINIADSANASTSINLTANVNIRTANSPSAPLVVGSNSPITSNNTNLLNPLVLTIPNSHSSRETFYAVFTMENNNTTISALTHFGRSITQVWTYGSFTPKIMTVELSMPANVYSQDLFLLVIDGSDQQIPKYTAVIRIQREAAGAPTPLVSAVNIHTVNTTISPLVTSSNTPISSISNPLIMTIPGTFRNTSVFYAFINLENSIDNITFASFGGSSTQIFPYSDPKLKSVELNLPVNVESRDLRLTFTGGYTATIRVQRATTFSGTIVDRISSKQAIVELYDITNENFISTVDTAPDGKYVFYNPIEGIYTVRITKPGFLTFFIKYRIGAGSNDLNIDITYMAGDVNGDGVINAEDLTILLSQFNKAPSGDYKESVDIDGNGIVNAVDLAYLLAGFNKEDFYIDLLAAAH